MLCTWPKEDLGNKIEFSQFEKLLLVLIISVEFLEVAINEKEELLNKLLAFLHNRRHAFMASSAVVEK